jgi:proteasome lid subunit RPN8/RPN11
MPYIKIRSRDVSKTRLVRPHPDTSDFEVFAASDGFLAFIHRDVLEFIKRHAQRTGSKETIGLLSGRTCIDPNAGPYSLVMAAGDAREGEFMSTAGDVRLLALGQTKVRRRLENAHPDREIIGWYHTHPTFDPRFSGVDEQEQGRTNDPNYIGIVFSGINADEPFGVYRGPDAVLLKRLRHGEPKPLLVPHRTRGFQSTPFLHGGTSSPSHVQQPAPLTPTAQENGEKSTVVTAEVPARRRLHTPVSVVVFAGTFLLIIQVLGFFWQHRRLSSAEVKLQSLAGVKPTGANLAEVIPTPTPCVPEPVLSVTSAPSDPEFRPSVKAYTPESPLATTAQNQPRAASTKKRRPKPQKKKKPVRDKKATTGAATSS